MKVCGCGETDQSKFYKTASSCRECHRKWVRDHRLRKLGLSREDYDAALAAQGGGCAICWKAETGVRSHHVDHDHATGRFRGILCARCNQVLGRVGDDIVVLRNMLAYLQRH